MVRACAMDTTVPEQTKKSFHNGCENQPVMGAVRWAGLDLAIMAWIAVVERVCLRYVTAEFTMINTIPYTAPKGQDRSA